MIRGIGVDSASISEMRRLLEGLGSSFVPRVFTERERAAAPQDPDRAAKFFADHFAVKEAVFKAVAHLLPEHTFDLRIVESLNHGDGSPYVNVTPELAPILERAGVRTIHVSVTNEADLATAFVVATDEA